MFTALQKPGGTLDSNCSRASRIEDFLNGLLTWGALVADMPPSLGPSRSPRLFPLSPSRPSSPETHPSTSLSSPAFCQSISPTPCSHSTHHWSFHPGSPRRFPLQPPCRRPRQFPLLPRRPHPTPNPSTRPHSLATHPSTSPSSPAVRQYISPSPCSRSTHHWSFLPGSP